MNPSRPEHTVSARVYDAPRGERRRIGKELARIRETKAQASAEAARLRGVRHPAAQQIAATIEASQRVSRVPLRLLACGVCHKPVPQCTCVDVDGKPLDWGLAK